MMKLTRKAGEILLAAVILARSTSFVMIKIGLQSMGTFTLLGLRFLLAFICLLPFGWIRLKQADGKTIYRGMLLGLAFFLVMAAEVSGIKRIDGSTVAFLENTALVIVPVFEAFLLRRLPKKLVVVSALITLCGVGLITLKDGGFSFSMGEFFSLTAAVFYAAAIILTDRVSKESDPLTLGILQVGFMGFFSIIAAFVVETPRLPAGSTEWGVILALALVCTGFGYTLQPLAQRTTTSERAGLFCALGPIGAAVTGFLVLGESFGPTEVLGIALILLGMFLGRMIEWAKKGRGRHESRSYHAVVEKAGL